MQKSFASYKCLMIAVNLSRRNVLRGDGAERGELQDAVDSANRSWTQACCSLESWETRLHAAVMQCQVRGRRGDVRFYTVVSNGEGPTPSSVPLQEFHETLHSLLVWLARAENKLSAIGADPAAPPSVLTEQRDALTVRPHFPAGGSPLLPLLSVCRPLVAGAAGGAAGAAAAGELAAGDLRPPAPGRRRRRRRGGPGEGPRHLQQAAPAAAAGRRRPAAATGTKTLTATPSVAGSGSTGGSVRFRKPAKRKRPEPRTAAPCGRCRKLPVDRRTQPDQRHPGGKVGPLFQAVAMVTVLNREPERVPPLPPDAPSSPGSCGRRSPFTWSSWSCWFWPVWSPSRRTTTAARCPTTSPAPSTRCCATLTDPRLRDGRRHGNSSSWTKGHSLHSICE